ncbi:MAG: hypothetical protein QOH15_646 [Gaiellales bacterium]|nr:hypothetical protein [Gaiellales bacterium]
MSNAAYCWDAFTTPELEVLFSWAFDAHECGELDTRALRGELRTEIDRRYATDFGGRILRYRDRRHPPSSWLTAKSGYRAERVVHVASMFAGREG